MKYFRLILLLTITILLCACGKKSTNGTAENQTDNSKVIIYSGAEDYRNEYFLKRLSETFPEYEIIIEYIPSGNMAAKIKAEGKETEADILYDIDYSYVEMLEPFLADLSEYDQSIFMEDAQSKSQKYIPELRNGGSIIVNPKVLSDKGLELPTCYEDLLSPQWKGLVSMPNPKSSGTGYMFLKNLVNTWGEEKAFDYFDKLSENILQFTSSGSGPVNALVQGEVAVGLGMTSQAVTAINEGAVLKIMYFEEGSPSSLYGYSIIDGKQNRKCVKEVMDFFYSTLVEEDKKLFFPEQIYKDKTFIVENYPTNIKYGDMSNNTLEEKLRLLEKWEY
ncbi:MAG: extracellular solute-binding protein [Lachnospiraceae bacterium]|nr:extracellular solute-binding protein [Lachnospiraceae bacterium]